jgi:beta-lactamase superfamily II metal-dependent hydrolase
MPAEHGDSILIIYGKEHTKILIDTGTGRAYVKGELKKEFNQTDFFDLLILTHVDEDHIGGILKYFNDDGRKEGILRDVWFNASKTLSKFENSTHNKNSEISIIEKSDIKMSVKQGVTLEKKLEEESLWQNRLISTGDQYTINNAKINILSPEFDDLKKMQPLWEIEIDNDTLMSGKIDYHLSFQEILDTEFKETGSIQNKTSIAFLFEYFDYKLLFLGDAFPSVVERQIRVLGYNESNKLNINFFKISHHGSKNATSPDLLKIIECSNFIISSNGKKGIPNKECLVRIIISQKSNVNLFFNYKNDLTQSIFTEEEQKQYNFNIIYLEDDYTITV